MSNSPGPHRDPYPAIILYQTEDGRNRIQVRLENETVWLTQKLMAELFQKDARTISEHIQNIFEEGELQPDSVIRKFRITAQDGKTYETNHYNLDVIISVGYRVKSHCGTQFRIWATQRLREYIVKRFALDAERLKGRDRLADYFDELLARKCISVWRSLSFSFRFSFFGNFNCSNLYPSYQSIVANIDRALGGTLSRVKLRITWLMIPENGINIGIQRQPQPANPRLSDTGL